MSTSKWTNKIPTEPGIYWYLYKGIVSRICEVKVNSEGIRFIYEPGYQSHTGVFFTPIEIDTKYQWQGPITPES